MKDRLDKLGDDLGGTTDAVKGELGEVNMDVMSVRHEIATDQARLEGEIARLTIGVEELKGGRVKLKETI